MPELSKELMKDSVKDSIKGNSSIGSSSSSTDSAFQKMKDTAQEKFNDLSSSAKETYGKIKDSAVVTNLAKIDPLFGASAISLVSSVVLFKTDRRVLGTITAIAAPCLLVAGIFKRMMADVKETDERKVAYH